jgi:Homeodomain-like domain
MVTIHVRQTVLVTWIVHSILFLFNATIVGIAEERSVLPECIPPCRWYLWEVQQMALSLFLLGKSLRAIAQEVGPSRHTISRWMNRFKEQFLLHKDVLCTNIADFGRIIDFTDFWQNCLCHFSLAQAMRLCHASGVTIP